MAIVFQDYFVPVALLLFGISIETELFVTTISLGRVAGSCRNDGRRDGRVATTKKRAMHYSFHPDRWEI
jgi:hypothetical protein